MTDDQQAHQRVALVKTDGIREAIEGYDRKLAMSRTEDLLKHLEDDSWGAER